MIPGMNKRQMEQAMRKLGMKQEIIEAEEVVIRTESKDIIISDPQVAKVDMMGQITFQISGTLSYSDRVGDAQTESEISEDDLNMVAEQTGSSKEDARSALKNADGDIAQAIMQLKEDKDCSSNE